MSLRVGACSVSVLLALAGSQGASAQHVPGYPMPPSYPGGYPYPPQMPYCPPGQPFMPGQQPGVAVPQRQPLPQQPSAQTPTTPLPPTQQQQQQPGTQPGQSPDLQAPGAQAQQAGTDFGQGAATGAGGIQQTGFAGGTDLGLGGGGDALAAGSAAAPPGIIGDFVGYQGTRLSSVRTDVTQVITQRVANGSGGFTTINVLYNAGEFITFAVPGAPIESRVNFKIIENESPIPMDRIYVRYNYYHDALQDISSATDAGNLGLIKRVNLHRETLGLEKTLWCEDFSIGLRVPFFQVDQRDNTSTTNTSSGQSFDASDIGDMTIILKAVIVRDPCNPTMLSGGVAVTVPTGPSNKVVRSDQPLYALRSGGSISSGTFSSGDLVLAQTGRNVESTLFQPFVGFVVDVGCGYVQGFSSVVLPVETEDIMLLSNSISVGYYLSDLVTPTIEFHLTTPLESQGFFGDPIGIPDQLVMTLGAHVHWWDCADTTFGLGIPVTGNSTFDVEGIVQMTFRF